MLISGATNLQFNVPFDFGELKVLFKRTFVFQPDLTEFRV